MYIILYDIKISQQQKSFSARNLSRKNKQKKTGKATTIKLSQGLIGIGKKARFLHD